MNDALGKTTIEKTDWGREASKVAWEGTLKEVRLKSATEVKVAQSFKKGIFNNNAKFTQSDQVIWEYKKFISFGY